jgi:hypothetical protein
MAAYQFVRFRSVRTVACIAAAGGCVRGNDDGGHGAPSDCRSDGCVYVTSDVTFVVMVVLGIIARAIGCFATLQTDGQKCRATPGSPSCLLSLNSRRLLGVAALNKGRQPTPGSVDRHLFTVCRWESAPGKQSLNKASLRCCADGRS